MFACILSVIVTIYLRIKNKNLHSPLITMELQGWQIDSVISLGMAFAFLLPLMIPFAWFDRVTPYLDQIITILLSVIMIQTPVRTVITGIPRSHADSTRGRNNRRHQKDRRTNHRYLRPQNLYYDIVRTGRNSGSASISHSTKISYRCQNSNTCKISASKHWHRNIQISTSNYCQISNSPELKKNKTQLKMYLFCNPDFPLRLALES